MLADEFPPLEITDDTSPLLRHSITSTQGFIFDGSRENGGSIGHTQRGDEMFRSQIFAIYKGGVGLNFIGGRRTLP